MVLKKQTIMKIGFDAKRAFHNTTGLGNYSRDLIRMLDDYYPENKYLLYNPKPKKVSRLQLKKSMTEILPEGIFWKKLSSIWRQGPIVKQLERDQIDIFHGLSGEIPKGLEKTTIKTVVTIHDLIFMRYPKLYSSIDRKIYFNKFKYAAEKADKIIAISQQTKEDIVHFLKINPEKITVIYQGCHATFKEKKSLEFKNTVLKKYKLPTEFILNVGTIEARKNVLSLIKAIKNIDISLVIVGRKTNYYTEIYKYIKEHKLHDKIYFIEGVSLAELSAIYQQAILFSYPSIFEGFGIPIIEALYSKTPVITTKGGVFPEAGGKHSIYVNPEKTQEFSEAIIQLLKNSEKREKITDLGYSFVQKFNDAVVAEKYYKTYKSLIK